MHTINRTKEVLNAAESISLQNTTCTVLHQLNALPSYERSVGGHSGRILRILALLTKQERCTCTYATCRGRAFWQRSKEFGALNDELRRSTWAIKSPDPHHLQERESHGARSSSCVSLVQLVCAW